MASKRGVIRPRQSPLGILNDRQVRYDASFRRRACRVTAPDPDSSPPPTGKPGHAPQPTRPSASGLMPEPIAPQPIAPAAPVPITDQAWFVLLIVFGVALFLAYPILWRTKAFRPATKVILSILVVVETVVLVALFCAAMWWSYHRIVEAL